MVTFHQQLTQYFPNLRARLKAHNISEASVARKAGMHPSQLSRLLNHPSDVRVSTIERIERVASQLIEATSVPQA